MSEKPKKKANSVKEAFEITRFAYEESVAALESINRRAGFGLSLSAAAVSAIAFKLQDISLCEFGCLAPLVKLIVILAVGLELWAVLSFFLVLKTRSTSAGYCLDDIQKNDMYLDPEEFYTIQIDDLQNGVKLNYSLSADKSKNYMRGVIAALLGIAVIVGLLTLTFYDSKGVCRKSVNHCVYGSYEYPQTTPNLQPFAGAVTDDNR